MTTVTTTTAPSWSEIASLLNALANLAKSAAWPLVTGGAIFCFRKHLGMILVAVAKKVPKLTKGKFSSVEIEAVAQLRAQPIQDLDVMPFEKNTPPGSRSKIISIARHPVQDRDEDTSSSKEDDAGDGGELLE